MITLKRFISYQPRPLGIRMGQESESEKTIRLDEQMIVCPDCPTSAHLLHLICSAVFIGSDFPPDFPSDFPSIAVEYGDSGGDLVS